MIFRKLKLRANKIMNDLLNKSERLDDLLINDKKIIQNKEEYCFTSDAVLLANFLKAGSKDVLVDLCSGSGIVGILASQKTNCKTIKLVEMQEHFVDLSRRSVELNNLQDRIEVIHSRVQDVVKILGRETVSVVCCNPPYRVATTHKISDKKSIAMCKYETELSLKELVKAVSDLLKFGGKFYCIHQSTRLAEICAELKAVKLEPKVFQFVYPKASLNSNVVLIEAQKSAQSGVIVKAPLILNKE